MPYPKGTPKPAKSGRKKGTPNKATAEIKEFARSILADPVYQTKLLQRLRDGDAPQLEVVFYYFAWGKPTEHLKLGHTMTLADLLTAAEEPDEQDQ